jgi:hypothetical protein
VVGDEAAPFYPFGGEHPSWTGLEVSGDGKCEGQITKYKLVERQMFGRAKLDLIQAILIDAARIGRNVIENGSDPSLREIS